MSRLLLLLSNKCIERTGGTAYVVASASVAICCPCVNPGQKIDATCAIRPDVGPSRGAGPRRVGGWLRFGRPGLVIRNSTRCEGPPRIATESSTGGEEGNWRRQSEREESPKTKRVALTSTDGGAGRPSLGCGWQSETSVPALGLARDIFVVPGFTRTLFVGKVVPPPQFQLSYVLRGWQRAHSHFERINLS
jgi:hypothetical protein